MTVSPAVAALIDPACFDADPIAIFERMAEAGSRVACVPLIYGYVSYAVEGFRPKAHRLRRHPSSRARTGPSALRSGGTGIAVSARSRHSAEAIDFAYWVAGPEAQAGVPTRRSGGQPGHADAWESPRRERARLQLLPRYPSDLWRVPGVRPRHDGAMPFQQPGLRTSSPRVDGSASRGKTGHRRHQCKDFQRQPAGAENNNKNEEATDETRNYREALLAMVTVLVARPAHGRRSGGLNRQEPAARASVRPLRRGAPDHFTLRQRTAFTPPPKPWKWCHSESYQGNPWRVAVTDELHRLVNGLIAKGIVSSFQVSDSNTDASQQINQIRAFIDKEMLDHHLGCRFGHGPERRHRGGLCGRHSFRDRRWLRHQPAGHQRRLQLLRAGAMTWIKAIDKGLGGKGRVLIVEGIAGNPDRRGGARGGRCGAQGIALASTSCAASTATGPRTSPRSWCSRPWRRTRAGSTPSGQPAARRASSRKPSRKQAGPRRSSPAP